MKDTVKVIYDSGNNYITLTNRKSDPGMWIMNVYKKNFLFRKKTGTYWYTGEADAMKHSGEIIKSVAK